MARSPLPFPAAAPVLMAAFAAAAAAPADEAPDQVAPCRRAHAHNDYRHERPLLDALANGFCSVEADVFLIDGTLLVAHSPLDLSPDRTLRSLYLDPLKDRVRMNGGSVYANGQHVTLLIDVKTNADSTYRALHTLLAEYRDVFTSVERGQVHRRAVTAIVSGNRAVEAIATDSPRYVGIDGRLSDLDSDQPEHLLPLISDDWNRHFRWRGEGDMPAADREKLKAILDRAHAKNRRVRFWASPDQPRAWAAQKDAGVDLINTDDLKGLSRFLRATRQPTAAAAEPDAFTSLLQPAFRQSCVKCHGAGKKVKGKVNLHALKSAEDLTVNLDLVEKLIDALDLEAMPPEDQPPLPPETRRQLVTELRVMLHEAVRARKSIPQTPIRRMNRFQYGNAVEDLFELNVEVFALPERMLRAYGYFKPETAKMPDQLKAGSRPLGKSQLISKRLAGVAPFPQDLRAEHGFDNQADHLSLSPLLLESFFKLSRSIVDSPDFNEKTCGIWNTFFAPPPMANDTETVVRQRLRQFLTRAFRQPADGALVDRYAGHVIERIESGESFTDSMKAAASAALASPRFLYLYDRAADEAEGESLADFDFASRLSFFLWGSIPDQTLLDLAAEGKLRDPAVLDEQLDRMLSDARLKRFCDSFPSQWLQLERIISSVPDPERFPEFYFAKYRSSMHMMLEPLLLFETILVENRSILELVDSDFSYRSDLLDSWYRDGTRGNRSPPTAIPFRRVNLADRRHGGVITNAAVMTMTSNAVRTQPITRGAWIAAVIFNDPPEPPPADVPPLSDEADEETMDLTLRERFAIHRERTDCAGCHARIDPLGFALENYGPTGLWRDKYENGRAVDASGVLFRKYEFTNVVQFKDAILAEKDRFARAFAGHLLSFALGRELAAADSPALDSIARETKAADYRMKSLIKAVVLSEPFLHSGIKPPRAP